MNEGYPARRLRRLRYCPALREAVASVRVHVSELVAPIFVHAGLSQRREIETMPGQFQRPVDDAAEWAGHLSGLGIRAVLLFGVPARKDAAGSAAWDEDEALQRTVGRIKSAVPELCVITDTCLCEYTDHGHCGPLADLPDGGRDVDNGAALAALARTAVSQARAGADVVAPSAMMDGQVFAIRAALDSAGFERTAILSYAVKYASSLYGPFREAAESPPAFGDRRTYQMDPRSPRQALAEARADLAEGADLLMVKPAAAYLDVISAVSSEVDAPVAAYHVSGEYAMIRLAAAAGAIDERTAALEITSAIKRAGADLIVTYFAEALASWL
jgi:porphobilinogen synthase